jgi:hypothetical protein
MKKTVLTFGLLSGATVSALTAVLMPLCISGAIDFQNGEILGYSAMVLSFLFVFFGIRSYRERVGGGAVSFGRAFAVGILIVAVSSAVYVVAWEIVYYNFVPDFLDQYQAHVLDKLEASGADAEALAAERAEMARFAELYANPLFNVAVTFLEVFPVGLLVTLVSAAILRRRRAPGPPEGAVPA